MKKAIAVAISFVTAFSCYTSAFAMESTQILTSANKNSITKKSSYTYVDLGNRTEKFSSHEAKVSVASLTALITAMSTADPQAAAKAASAVYVIFDTFSDGTVYFTVKSHTTQVFLDGEFSHYIIDTEIYAYSNPSRTHLETKIKHSGKSLSPFSLPVNYEK